MQLINACIKKPLVVFIITVAVFFAGIFSLRYIPVDLVPLPTDQSVDIQVNYSGASPSVIQSQITKKLMSSIQPLAHIDSVSGKSTTGSGSVHVELTPLSKIEALKTFAAINQAVSTTSLPSQADAPVTTQGSSSSGLLSFLLYSKTSTPLQLQSYYENRLELPLKKIQGVSKISVTSDVTNPIVRIKLNPKKLQQYQLNATDIMATLNGLNKSYPLGSMVLHNKTYLMSIDSKTNSLPEIENLVIAKTPTDEGQSSTSAKTIYLKDIATVSYEDQSLLVTHKTLHDGANAISVNLVAEGQANPIQITKQVTKLLGTIKKSLPPGMHLKVYENSGQLVDSSVHEVLWTIVLTAILVIIICFAFLGRFRNTLIPVVTIPVCLTGVLIFLSLFGFSINLFTLLAMVIAIGIVVDDAIVVVEHITVYLEKGMPLKEAVIKGSKEIALTIVGITLTLCVVYIPTLMMSGFFAIWYKQFTITLAICVALSGLLALTLSPVMCYYLLKNHKENRYQHNFNQVFHKIIHSYQFALGKLLDYKKVTLLVTAVLIALGMFACTHLQKGIMSKDPNTLITFQVNGKPGETATGLAHKIDHAMSGFLPHDKRIQLRYVVSSNDQETGKVSGQYQMVISADHIKEMPQIADLANQYIKTKTHLDGFARAGQFFNFGGSGSDISFNVLGDQPKVATENANKIAAALKQNPAFLSVDIDTAPVHPQYVIHVDAERALQAGISQSQLNNMLEIMLGGEALNNAININGHNTAIYLQVDPAYLESMDSLQYLTIKSSDGKSLPVTDFIKLDFKPAPMMIQSLNGYTSISIGINLAKGYSISRALPIIDKTIQEKTPGVLYQYDGNVKQYFENNQNSIYAFLLGILAVYLILAILFNSIVDPLIILFTVPFSLLGGALSLFLIDGTINIVTTIALITLVGLITKHGVLVVQFANMERKRGLSKREAILSATANRFRPIMMTTFAMMVGSLPLIFAMGQGYVMRKELGLVLFSGLLIGTLFSLFIVPLVYLVLSPKKHS